MPQTVMIVSGETSGELYGALLAASLKKNLPGIRVIGIGGERMREAGVELISGIASAFGLTEALSSLKAIKETFARAADALRKERPGVLVLIDYPDFNLKLAALARKNNTKILYYVSPQVWAWRRNRIKKISRMVDRMAVILPFEEEIYRGTGLDCEFVGHPVLDEIHQIRTTSAEAKEALGLPAGKPLLSLLPGSRPHELQRLLPLMLAVIRRFRKEFGEFGFCIPLAPNTDLASYEKILDRFREEGALINKGESLRVLSASDLAVIASGTATLQAAFLGVPSVVVYKLFPLTFWLGKMIVQVKHISLVNILAGREVVKELLQRNASPEKIVAELRRILTDSRYRQGMLESFGEIRAKFDGRRPSDRVADIVIDMAGWK
ncbi:MAG: lipid-A-disaccharide synthase [Nitrospiraceae bacterium]|nr:lipid-A-disaccharide synthase [Nitrospiraceae bacterium]